MQDVDSSSSEIGLCLTKQHGCFTFFKEKNICIYDLCKICLFIKRPLKSLDSSQLYRMHCSQSVDMKYIQDLFFNALAKTYLCIKCHKTDCWPEIHTG